MENLFSQTPYTSIADVMTSIKEDSAKLTFNRSAAYNIGTQLNRSCFFTFLLGFILATIIVIVFSIQIRNYWLLITIPFLFILNTMAPHLKFIPILAAIIGVFCVVLHWPLWVLTLMISIVVLFIGYNIWWGITYNIVRTELLKNEPLFIDMWKSNSMGIRDNKGNFYVYKPEV